MAELQQGVPRLCAEVLPRSGCSGIPRSGCTPTKPKIVLYKFAFRKLGRTANRIKSIRPIHPVRPARPSGTYPPRRAGRTGSKYAKIIQLYLGMAYELRKPAMQICFDIIYRLKFVHRPLLAGETLSYSVKFGLLPAPSLVGRQRNYPERYN